MKNACPYGQVFFEYLFDFYLTRTVVRVIVCIEQKFEKGGSEQ